MSYRRIEDISLTGGTIKIKFLEPYSALTARVVETVLFPPVTIFQAGVDVPAEKDSNFVVLTDRFGVKVRVGLLVDTINGAPFAGSFTDLVAVLIEMINLLNQPQTPPTNSVFLDTINGDLLPCFVDPNRGNRILSAAEFSFNFGENTLNNNDWLTPIANANDADSCFIVKRDSLITFSAYNCENAGTAVDLDLWIGAANITTLFTTINQNIYQQGSRNDLIVEVFKDDRIRARRGGGGSTIRDTVLQVSGHYWKQIEN